MAVHYQALTADHEVVEIDRCPGCGAKVRPDSSWCSLCYQDLRPEPQLVTASVQSDADADNVAAPLVEASLEPEPAAWTGAVGADDIVDAEIVGEDGRIIAPRSGTHDSDSAPTSAADTDGEDQLPGEPSGLAALTWSCKCGEIVSMAESACSVCGSSFLGELRDGNGGRHRPGNSPLNWLPESRQVRLALSVFVAIAFSALMTLIISIFG